MDRFSDNTYSYEEKPANTYSLENELRKTIQRQKKTIFSLAERNRVWKIICAVLAVLLVVESVLLWANSGDERTDVPKSSQVETQTTTSKEEIAQTPSAYEVDEDEISQMLSQMTLVDKIHQMLFVTPEELTGYESVTAAGESTNSALDEHKVGGVIYSNTNIESSEQTEEMLGNTQDYAYTPLFLGIARDGGSIVPESSFSMPSQTIIGAYSNDEQVISDYSDSAAELTRLGFNVNFAPNTELVSAAKGATSGSFGNDAAKLAKTVALAVNGHLKKNMCTALKYFPTNMEVERTTEQLRQAEFEVYKAGIEAGADFVMVSHVVNGAVESEEVPYSMSRAMVTDVLKGELGFDGIVITAPLTELEFTDEFTAGDAAIACVKAGADMLLCPSDMQQVVEDINEAVRVGDIDVSVIDESVKRILRVKQKRGIIK
ncbi:MAG: glycoside hydrolase family 3 protein [Clostridia bacterium]|nr:glycoside hydrolase family 3 protein [Clostridia bacterium]